MIKINVEVNLKLCQLKAYLMKNEEKTCFRVFYHPPAYHPNHLKILATAFDLPLALIFENWHGIQYMADK